MAINIGKNSDGDVTYQNPPVNRVLFPNITEYATAEVIEEFVNTWLDDHPEATTTVEDGSILPVKLDSTNSATDGHVLSYNATAGKFEWYDIGGELDDINSDITDLKQDLNNLVDDGLIDLKAEIHSGRVLNGYSTVTLEPEVNADWVYAIIPCKEGDKFVVSGSGGTSYRPYSFVTGTESPYTTLLLYPSTTDPADEIEITAPYNSTYLVFDSRASYEYSLCKVYYPPIYSEDVKNSLNELGEKTDFVSTNEDGIQDWWCYPVGYHYKNIRDKAYYTFTDSNGAQGIFEYDYNTKETHKRILTHDIVDEHCTPAVYIKDGKILVACTGHSSKSYISIFNSSKVESIEQFDDEIRLSTSGERLSYVQILYANNKYWLFTRLTTLQGKFKWCFSYSDEGEEWSELKPFIDGVNTQCYLLVRNYEGTKLKVYETANASDASNTEIRMFYLDTATGNILDVDETILANINSITDPIPYTDLTVVLDKPSDTTKSQRLLSCGNGLDMSIAVSRFTASDGVTAPSYHIGDYDSSDHTYSLVEFPYIGSVFQAYYTQHIEIVGNYFVASTSLNAGKTIEAYTREGNTFTKVSTIATEAQESNVRLLRPFQIVNKDAVVFERGIRSGTSYTNFYMDLHIGNVSGSE